MRFPLRFAVATLLVVTACQSFLDDLSCLGGAKCDPAKASNTPGSCAILTLAVGSHLGACTEQGTCNLAGDACISDTCISCGQPGEVCCDQQGVTGCTGSVCIKGADDFPTCHADCGQQNHVCCPGSTDPCPISGYCDASTNQCVPDSNDVTGGDEYFVWVKTPGKCAESPYHFNATSTSDAQAKADAHLAALNVGITQAADKYTLAPLKTLPIEYDLCLYPLFTMNSIDPITIYAFNTIERESCKAEKSGGTTQANWGWQGTDNSCPAIPNPNPPSP